MSDGPFRDDRVTLRAMEPADVDALHAYLNEPSLFGRRYLPWDFPDVAPLSRRQVTEILESWSTQEKSRTLGIGIPDTGKLVGHVGCRWGWDTHCPTVWLAVGPEHQRSGIGSAALRLTLEHLFENTPAHNVNGRAAGWNDAGLAFAAHHGFTVSGRIPRGGLRDGAWFEDIVLDILKPEWRTTREAPHGA